MSHHSISVGRSFMQINICGLARKTDTRLLSNIHQPYTEALFKYISVHDNNTKNHSKHINALFSESLLLINQIWIANETYYKVKSNCHIYYMYCHCNTTHNVMYICNCNQTTATFYTNAQGKGIWASGDLKSMTGLYVCIKCPLQKSQTGKNGCE